MEQTQIEFIAGIVFFTAVGFIIAIALATVIIVHCIIPATTPHNVNQTTAQLTTQD